MLPMLAKDHASMLTLNNNDLPIYKDILLPGMDVPDPNLANNARNQPRS